MKKITMLDAVDIVMEINFIMNDKELSDTEVLERIVAIYAEYGVKCNRRPKPPEFLILR